MGWHANCAVAALVPARVRRRDKVGESTREPILVETIAEAMATSLDKMLDQASKATGMGPLDWTEVGTLCS